MFSETLIPEELFLGDYTTHEIITKDLTVTNSELESKNITFYSLCDCLSISPENALIPPGESKTFTITLEPEGYGKMSRHFLVDINGVKQTTQVYINLPETPVETLANGCPECRAKEIEIADKENAEKILNQWKVIDIYYSPGCTTCEEFISEASGTMTINKHNILEPSELEKLELRLKDLNVNLNVFPIVIYKELVLQGDEVKVENIKDESTSSSIGFSKSAEYLKPIPVIVAGLIDGINPCAFTTLLFLISTLFYLGRKKKEILKIGVVFTVTIFISYYLVGLGFMNVIRTAIVFPIISTIIRYVLLAALVVLALLSFYDAYKAKKGLVNDMKLQLPKSIKKRIHTVIRENSRNRGLITGTIVIGVMVTVFELTCTGQVYLPIITYIIKMDGNLSGYFYLTLYNLGFILPLILVFFTVYKGTSNKKIADWFSNKLFLIKILLGLLFIGMIPFI